MIISDDPEAMLFEKQSKEWERLSHVLVAQP